MFAPWKKIAASLSAAALLSAGAGGALAQDHHPSHDHGKPPQLTLDNGKKWATDDNLRLGMGRIRDALAAELPAIHSGKATAEQYQALAQKTNDQIAFMVKNCKMGQQMDAVFHVLLVDLVDGAHAMMAQGDGGARKGAEKIARALESYDAYFDHPGWHGAKHAH